MCKTLLMAAFTSLLMAVGANAVETTITVRVLAKDAKFIGTSMGGAAVTIKDAQTGEMLAEGLTAGGTGDTELIMKTPRERFGSITSEGSAHFTATLDLDRPRLIEVSARGPMSPEASAVTATSRQWVVPGKHITKGDAWLLELRGLVVELVGLAEEVAAGELKLQAKVRMLCGCPTAPGGLWDGDKMEINAILEKDGAVTEVPLIFTGETSHFAAMVPVTAGAYKATFYAYQPVTGNTGVQVAHFTVR